MSKHLGSVNYVAIALAFLFSINAYAKANIETKTKSFSVELNTSRIVYLSGAKNVTFSVNNPQDYPILVRSTVVKEDKKTAAPFIVTPPLFRLDAKQTNSLRVIQTGGSFPENKETLHWLCIAGIPPKEDDVWAQRGQTKSNDDIAQLNVKISVNNCIKLFVRPQKIKGDIDEGYASLKWQRKGNVIVAQNPSPFYISIASIKIGGKELPDMDYIAPFSSHEFALPQGASGERVAWQAITDYGGKTKTFEKKIQ
ncbi:fimbria/pilus periplasmic chaperone [Serratia sp. UGAL515B_01]|uniref:fimbria/pilus periplasmic chaperone n=1 Tax=Serratia sp. UGAL515B_01 TaxID=2986763 RepID=UPI00295303B0|nr:fimbria/pilus periplasmic chaperone [Serratia sp. UGAL515B_01]WON76403.1 fimbria/pilus periplasmic chaperone [Serratia sp. UGAL515B_01]